MQKIGDITDTADGNGEFTDGSVAGNVQPTELMAAWFTTVQREIIAVLTEAGIEPDKANDAQLNEAIKIIMKREVDGSGFLLSKNNLSDLVSAEESRGHLGLKTASTKDTVTSMVDATAGRVPVVGWMGLGGYGTDNMLAAADVKKTLRNGFYGVQSEPTYGNASLISFGFDSGSQVHLIAKQGGQAPVLGVCGSTPQGEFGNWGKIYTEFQKPTAGDVGALPIGGGTVTGNAVVNGTLGVGNNKKFEIMSQNSSALSGALLLWGNADRPTVFEFKDGSGFHFYSQRNKDGSISLVVNGGMSLSNWSNFDDRYQAKGNYAAVGASYTKAESDAKYQVKGNYAAVGASYTKAESDGRYQPKGSYAAVGASYTKAESDGRYVQNIRLGAVESSSSWGEKSPYVVTGSDKNVGDDYVGHAVRRPLQKLVNGTWINAGW